MCSQIQNKKSMQIFINPSREKWNKIIERPTVSEGELKNIVADILADVRRHGDAAIKKYCLQFGKVLLDDLKVSEDEISEAVLLVDKELKEAIGIAKSNIEKFHQSQIEETKKIETSKGVWCWRRSVAID